MFHLAEPGLIAWVSLGSSLVGEAEPESLRSLFSSKIWEVFHFFGEWPTSFFANSR